MDLIGYQHWSVRPIASTAQLADELTRKIHAGCAGFELNRYLFLNIFTCQRQLTTDYAIIRPAKREENFLHLLTFRFTGVSSQTAAGLIEKIVTGGCDRITESIELPAVFRAQLETPEQHEECYLCTPFLE